MKVLVVEDEPEIRGILQSALFEAGFEVDALENANGILARLDQFVPDIVLLDQFLPGKSGVEALRELRAHPRYQALPVIMVTAAGGEKEKVEALNGGADDYVVKPFLPRELAARIHAVLRRVSGKRQKSETFRDGALYIDFAAHQVYLRDKPVPLTLTEFRILAELVGARGQVLSRDQLRRHALGNLHVTDRTIDVHMASLRKKIAERGHDIETVRGVGYRFAIA